MVEFLSKYDLSVHEEDQYSKSVGEAVVVVHFDPSANGENALNPKIATIREKITKPRSRKVAGQTSILIETRKVGEQRIDTIRGGLSEMCNDQVIKEVGGNLFIVSGGLGFTELDRNIVGLSVVAYNGSLDTVFKPASEEEADFNGWIRVGDVLGGENVRGIAKTFLEESMNQGLITNVIANFQTPGLRTPIFPYGFSIDSFLSSRDLIPDMPYNP